MFSMFAVTMLPGKLYCLGCVAFQRLATTAEEIKSKCPSIETKCITADFSESAESGLYDRIAEELAGIEVGILVGFHVLGPSPKSPPRSLCAS